MNVSLVKNIVPQGMRFGDLAEIKAFIDDFIQQSGKEILHFALQLLGVPGNSCFRVTRLYDETGYTRFSDFAPYAAYVVKVDLLFYMGILYDLISKDRPSNKIDIAYLYYLPFCMVFSSNDKLHARTAPLLMEMGQKYIEGSELKRGLKELDRYYSEHMDEIERVGIIRFASYPPSDLDNSITRLWDEYLPGWRERSLEQRRGDTEHSDDDIIARLERAQTQSMPVEFPANIEAADYSMVSRRVRVRRGKRRIMPPGVEDE
jgi:hypothetical protein